MLNKVFRFICSILLLFVLQGASAPISAIQFGSTTDTPKLAQERVHLQLDKENYLSGEHIWFKGYVLDEDTMHPTTLSTVLYVDLIAGQHVLQTLKLPIEAGVSWGDLKLADSISSGRYRIRAYTQWMRNAGEESFFEQSIRIGNPKKQMKVQAKISWELVRGADSSLLTARITFRDAAGVPITNQSIGSKVDVAGTIFSEASGRTDDQGVYRISFQRPKGQTGAMRLVASLQLGDQQVTKGFVIPPAERFGISFFPEGGHLVKGIPAKIVVRASDFTGKPLRVSGRFADQNGVETTFTTSQLGLGSFNYFPSSTETQKVEVTFSDGSTKDYFLPKIEESGYTMGLKTNGVLQLYLSADRLNTGLLTLVCRRKDKTYFSMEIPTSKQAIRLVIPVKGISTGILELSLLSSDQKLLCQRKMFIPDSGVNLALSVEGLRQTYTTRSPVEISLAVKQHGQPVGGSLSVSVTNTSVTGSASNNQGNILNSILFGVQPSSPFPKPSIIAASVQEDIDLFMLAGSWEEFSPNSTMNKDTVNYPAERNLTVSGTVTSHGKPLANAKLSLMKSAGGFSILNTLSDGQGKFRFDSISFADSTRLLVQARTAEDKKNVKIQIDQIPQQAVTLMRKLDEDEEGEQAMMNYLQANKAYYDRQLLAPIKGATQLKQVEIVGGRNLKEDYVRKHGKADQEFTSKELDSAAFLSQVLIGKIRGSYRNYGIVLDGVRLVGTELAHFFLATDPASLERIEVLSSPHLLAAYGRQTPVMFVTSKRSQTYSNVKYAPGLTTLTPKGFSSVGVFYAPDHSTNLDSQPDLRPTVYWNPNLQTDETGKLKLKYYNTDLPGKYQIVIEGIGGNGGLIHQEFFYEVK